MIWWHLTDRRKRQRVGPGSSVTRLGDFFNFLVTNFSYKSSPYILVPFWAIWILQLSCKNYLDTFWAILGKIGQLFIPSLVTLPGSLARGRSFRVAKLILFGRGDEPLNPPPPPPGSPLWARQWQLWWHNRLSGLIPCLRKNVLLSVQTKKYGSQFENVHSSFLLKKLIRFNLSF